MPEIDLNPVYREIQEHIERLRSIDNPSDAVQKAIKELQKAGEDIVGACRDSGMVVRWM